MNSVMSPSSSGINEIVGESEQIRWIKRLIDVAAPLDAAVLITGETGTGKELLARRLHDMSKRRDRAFVPVNCAAIPDSLIESELFGFEKGAFTGANSTRDGRLAQANHGTLFLDEIGDLSLPAQAKLLRVLEEKEVQPLGSAAPHIVDFRVVAATNRDVAQLASEQKFRQDLLFRLNVIQIDVPPLRERQKDIALIACHFLEKLRVQYGRPGIALTSGAQRWLERQPWLGNARELRNVIERAFVFADSRTLRESDVRKICHSGTRWRTAAPPAQPTELARHTKGPQQHQVATAPYRAPKMSSSAGLEADRVRAALEQTKWNKSKAAELLRCSRMTVHRKVMQYELCPAELAKGASSDSKLATQD